MRALISAFLLVQAMGLLPIVPMAEAAEPAGAAAADASAADASAPAAETAAAAEQAAPAPPPPPLPALRVRREQQQSNLLKKWYGEQTVSLQTAEGDFVGIWQDDSSGKPLGALLMLHDASQMPDWPAQLQPLRQYLSRHGWATLSISLPEPDARVLPLRPEPPQLPPPPPSDATAKEGDGAAKESDGAAKEGDGEKKPAPDEKPAEAKPAEKPADNNEKATQGESKEVFNDATGKIGDGSLPAVKAPPKQEVLPSPPAEPLAQARIGAALALLKDKKQYNNSLLGVGLGAARAAYFVVQHQGDPAQQAPDGAPLTPPFQTLLLINPRMQIDALVDFNLIQALTNPKMPVLDISYRTHPAAPNFAPLRKAAARKNNLAVFEQHIILEPEGSDGGEEQLNRIVRGFLVKYAKGKQIKGGEETP